MTAYIAHRLFEHDTLTITATLIDPYLFFLRRTYWLKHWPLATAIHVTYVGVYMHVLRQRNTIAVASGHCSCRELTTVLFVILFCRKRSEFAHFVTFTGNCVC